MVLYNRSNGLPSMANIVRFARNTSRPGKKQSHSVGKTTVGAEPAPTPIVKRGITLDVSRSEYLLYHNDSNHLH